MALQGSVGIAGKAQKIIGAWEGIAGVAQKMELSMVGIAGKAQKSISCSIDAGQIVFTSSQIWTAPETMVIDIFCVGGGGGGTLGNGAGAGGGYTFTVSNARVTKGTTYAAIVGAGGLGRTNGGGTPTDGGDSSFGSLCTAKGGQSSAVRQVTNQAAPAYTVGSWSCGGSGGGQQYGGLGGADGANGGIAPGKTDTSDQYKCAGQGTTTRAFGESTGTLYSTGGDSYADGAITTYPVAGANNTGDGGDSGTYGGVDGANGGSGVVMIRWAAQEV